MCLIYSVIVTLFLVGLQNQCFVFEKKGKQLFIWDVFMIDVKRGLLFSNKQLYQLCGSHNSDRSKGIDCIENVEKKGW